MHEGGEEVSRPGLGFWGGAETAPVGEAGDCFCGGFWGGLVGYEDVVVVGAGEVGGADHGEELQVHVCWVLGSVGVHVDSEPGGWRLGGGIGEGC